MKYKSYAHKQYALTGLYPALAIIGFIIILMIVGKIESNEYKHRFERCKEQVERSGMSEAGKEWAIQDCSLKTGFYPDLESGRPYSYVEE
jgi:hypothetical protein